MDVCTNNNPDNDVYLLVNCEWVEYRGSTSLRKIYYRAYEAYRFGRQSFYLHEFSNGSVKGAMFPNDFHNFLKCSSMDGIPAYALPQRIILKKKMCDWVSLGNCSGSICLHCGFRK